jgi:hypothetical protein
MDLWTVSPFLLQSSPGSAVVDFQYFQWPDGVSSHPRTHGDVSGKAKQRDVRTRFRLL